MMVKFRRLKERLGDFNMVFTCVLKYGYSWPSSSEIIQPAYRITPEEIKLANLRAMSICSPSEFTPSCIFTKSGALKSHDWKEVCGACLMFFFYYVHASVNNIIHVACLLWNA